jgi:PEGA domain
MTRTRFITSVAVVIALATFATPAAAQRRGHSGAVSRGRAVARSRPVIVPRTVIVNRGYYRPYYYRPYYRFVPRINLGIGLWAGYPVAWPSYYYGYPYSYGYPYHPYYGYPPAPSAGYPYGTYPSTQYPASSYPSTAYPSNESSSQAYSGEAPDTVDVEPGSAPENTGGVSFDIDPPTASVFVDGKYMGTGAEFDPNSQPLGLTPGRHRVEIRAEGYQSMTFDADVKSGEVIPYKASLQRR